nr:hypothetical protein [Tanacetum cinerariifolium]
MDFNMDFGLEILTDGPAIVEMVNATKESFDEDNLAKFQELLLDVEKPFYKGCPDFTRLFIIVKLLNLKGKYGAYDKFFTELLRLIKKMLPDKHVTNENEDGKPLLAGKSSKVSREVFQKAHLYATLASFENKKLGKRIALLENKHSKSFAKWLRKEDGESLESYYSRFYKMMNELIRNQCNVTNHQVNVQLLLQLQPQWQRFVTLVKQSQDLKTVSYHKLYDILKQHQHEVNEIRAEKIARIDTYDTSIKENFNLRAVMLWTINDYPALGTLCGCPYSGFNVGKIHIVRQKKAFNGQQEFHLAPNPLTREQIYNKVQHIENKWGKGKRTNNKTSENQEDTRGKEKNVCESLVGTLLNVPRKTKDGMNARLDLAELGIKPKLFAREVKLCGPICFRWMYPFERCMKVIKGHVQNRNRPEGCIAEETIKEETIELFSEYLKTMKTIGIPPDKHVTNENEDEKPLSVDKSSDVFGEVFQKAHLYVIQNTDEIVPCI